MPNAAVSRPREQVEPPGLLLLRLATAAACLNERAQSQLWRGGRVKVVMIRMRACVLGVVVAVISVCASPAWGAFPGRNGDLVVGTGAGLELVAPGTGAARSICTGVVLCGHPAQPSVSPNGRAIVFVDGTSHRPVVIASDGSCLWCLVGAPLTSVTGSEPSFMTGGQAVSVAQNGLWSVSLTGGRPRRAPQGPCRQRRLVLAWGRGAGARGLRLGRATRSRKAPAAGTRALPVVLAGRFEACARSRRLRVDRAGCGRAPSGDWSAAGRLRGRLTGGRSLT